MSWNTLTNSELQAMRKLLMLDVTEAAELIGKCSTRSWQYWESGRSPVPGDVDMEIYGLIQLRNDKIDHWGKWQMENQGKELQLNYYHTFEQYQLDHPTENKVSWRVHQAAVSFLFSEGGDIELI